MIFASTIVAVFTSGCAVVGDLGRTHRICSPSSGFVKYSAGGNDAARILFAQDLKLRELGNVSRYVKQTKIHENTASVWLTATGLQYLQLGNDALVQRPSRLPLSDAIQGAWTRAYASAYALGPENECDLLVIYSPKNKIVFKGRHMIEIGP